MTIELICLAGRSAARLGLLLAFLGETGGCGSDSAVPVDANGQVDIQQASGTRNSPGSLSFELENHAALTLPVVACSGFGEVLTLVGRAGDDQVDARLIEAEAMRAGRPLEQSTVVSYRLSGESDGVHYEELWTTSSNQAVVRQGHTVTIHGTLTAQRFFAVDDLRFGPGQPIDSGRNFRFTLTAQCGG